MRGLRYRTGLDARTGQPLRGWPHVVQSLETIWSTRLGKRVMRLGFGSELFSRLGEDITPALALQLYTDLTVAAHTWEPEYRITSMQLVNLTSAGALGLRHSGTYYPEGRFGIYDHPQSVEAAIPLMLLRSSEGASA
ncbi:hypothetical protein SAMN05421512_1174 [Stappia indica]|uniref:IraD/Gp25-like domain-containing protein n=1 Tax=Stappia indica TaxID=538381 RepID=A0A285TSQ8_9HYPH|nr:hypothetical protein SAMN05421512_1174 [Stappia indica]